MTLADFLLAAAADGSPWNCSTFPADWCVARGHPDFAAPWRHLVSDDECEAAAVGGLVALWDRGIGAALPTTEQPAAGDIAVIRRACLEAGAIFTGERWAIRTKRGISFVPLGRESILKAWRP